MRRYVTSVLAAAVLIAPVYEVTAASKSPKLARCDGKKRRPANPFGTILPSVDTQAGTSTPAAPSSGRGGVDVFTDPATLPPASAKPAATPDQIPPIGSVSPVTSYRSC